MKRLMDKIRARDSMQVLLKKKGKPVGGIYSDDTREYRSPNLDKKVQDAEVSKKD